MSLKRGQSDRLLTGRDGGEDDRNWQQQRVCPGEGRWDVWAYGGGAAVKTQDPLQPGAGAAACTDPLRRGLETSCGISQPSFFGRAAGCLTGAGAPLHPRVLSPSTCTLCI